jgi:hypothetical protein
MSKSARRCHHCEVNWPDQWSSCPACTANTIYHAQAEAISNDEARVLIRRAEFDRFYAEREDEVEHDLSHIDRVVEEVRWLESIPVDGDPLPVEKLPPERFGENAHLLDP